MVETHFHCPINYLLNTCAKVKLDDTWQMDRKKKENSLLENQLFPPLIFQRENYEVTWDCGMKKQILSGEKWGPPRIEEM